MRSPPVIKPTQKAVAEYYQTLREYGAQDIQHEGAVETAFSRLLADTARSRGWLLIPKLSAKRAGKTIIPDGTVRDEFNLARGYWEAKDTGDDLTAEIGRKAAKGYPLTNTIFEDTRRAVLFQNGQESLQADLTQPQRLCDLLNAFYAYTEPDIEGFEQAVGEFKERVPDLAAALAEKIKEAHQHNPRFQAAFDQFFTVCQTALNPNISQAAVDEMLVQHLLTERLIRTIFAQDDFTRKNVIAAEVEKVISALVSQSFSRQDFLKQLDRFYKAIEAAAAGIEDFTEKQHFLNTVYERFFQGYSVKVADTHGIVYTPQPIVDFMCASVVEVLKSEFGKELGDKDVYILDPCTGTGNFIVNLLRRIPKKDLKRMYRQQLFANEVMLLPYYIAALNIEHAYYEATGEYESFDGLCFVDTLDMVEAKQHTFGFMTEVNTQRVERQRKSPITVIIGNPPYNAWQLDENDNNKNRKYAFVDGRIRDTYGNDSIATNRNALSDPYVKFFRWATDRLQDRDGIVALVSNNSFVDQVAFDGMRKHLLSDFTYIYHLHLEGNVRQNPSMSGTAYNVFGIQVGVGITIGVRAQKHKKPKLFFSRIDKTLRRHEKLGWLEDHGDLRAVDWISLVPDARNTWLVPQNSEEFRRWPSIATKEAKLSEGAGADVVFRYYSIGVKTNRDSVVYDFRQNALLTRIKQFIEDYNSEVDRFKRAGSVENVDDFVRYDRIKWSRDLKKDLLRGRYAEFDPRKIRRAQYRPFTQKYLFFDAVLN